MIAKCVTNVLTTLKFLTSSVIYYWTDAQQHGIYLFYVIKKQTITAFFISKSFYITQKPAFAPFGKHTKKAIWRNLLLWLVQKNHATVRLDFKWLLVEWRRTVKAELNCEIYKCYRKCWKNQVSFRHQSRAANNGRSTDNVWSELAIDRTNLWMAGHVRSITNMLREI